jgi:hypothetical protein
MKNNQKSLGEISFEILKCAIFWEPQAKFLGNISAIKRARIAIKNIDCCPKCGSTAFVNIDYDLCMLACDIRG